MKVHMKSLLSNFFFKIEIYLACYMLEYNINNHNDNPVFTR